MDFLAKQTSLLFWILVVVLLSVVIMMLFNQYPISELLFDFNINGHCVSSFCAW